MKAMKFDVSGDAHLSEMVQRVLFEMGAEWPRSGKNQVYLKQPYLFVYPAGYISHGGKDSFIRSDNEEINIDWMRTPKPEQTEITRRLAAVETEIADLRMMVEQSGQ